MKFKYNLPNKYKVLIASLATVTVSIGLVFAINTISTGYRIVDGAPATNLTIYSYCRDITAPAGRDMFVPTNTFTEYSRFLSNPPPGTVTTCIIPVNGVCGPTVAGLGVYKYYSPGNYCAVGTFSGLSGTSGPYTPPPYNNPSSFTSWNCVGEGTGSTANCGANCTIPTLTTMASFTTTMSGAYVIVPSNYAAFLSRWNESSDTDAQVVTFWSKWQFFKNIWTVSAWTLVPMAPQILVYTTGISSYPTGVAYAWTDSRIIYLPNTPWDLTNAFTVQSYNNCDGVSLDGTESPSATPIDVPLL